MRIERLHPIHRYPVADVQGPQNRPPRSVGASKFADSTKRFSLGASFSMLHANSETYATVIGTA